MLSRRGVPAVPLCVKPSHSPAGRAHVPAADEPPRLSEGMWPGRGRSAGVRGAPAPKPARLALGHQHPKHSSSPSKGRLVLDSTISPFKGDLLKLIFVSGLTMT